MRDILLPSLKIPKFDLFWRVSSLQSHLCSTRWCTASEFQDSVWAATRVSRIVNGAVVPLPISNNIILRLTENRASRTGCISPTTMHYPASLAHPTPTSIPNHPSLQTPASPFLHHPSRSLGEFPPSFLRPILPDCFEIHTKRLHSLIRLNTPRASGGRRRKRSVPRSRSCLECLYSRLRSCRVVSCMHMLRLFCGRA